MAQRSDADRYWFPDYVGDLDAILDHYSSGAKVNLAGHGMCGNVVCLYAGVRPQRIAKLVNLEGFGLLAEHWAAQNDQGAREILGDPTHKRTNPVLYRVDEVLACSAACSKSSTDLPLNTIVSS